jgi:poly(3-hydroxybutyrate) depolymerase
MRGNSAGQHVARMPLPVIVFHGDQDRTVHPRNAAQIIQAAQEDTDLGTPRVEQGVSGGGQRFTRTLHGGPDTAGGAEHWLLHGAGHAWSGGHASGSYTDPRGADASREMLRFFRAHAKVHTSAAQPA